MPSRVARETARLRAEKLLALTPSERVETLIRLSEQGMTAYMTTHGVDRATARSQIAASRRLGRSYSRSAMPE